MDAVKFVKEYLRMCTKVDECEDCPVYKTDFCTVPAMERSQESAEEIVELVEEWSAAHPRKTRQSVFLEQWPEERVDDNVEGGKGMSKAVMISIRPKWCEKICSGEKTIEVRKTRPKLETPFKVYIYCTLPKYPHEDFIATDYPKPQFYGGGKVIGEFICDRIYELETRSPGGSYYVKGEDQPTTNDVARQSCLTLKDMHDYLQAKAGYGWHISNLKIYDPLKDLSEFSRPFENCIDKVCDEFGCASCENGGHIKRPPQSLCYVENMAEPKKPFYRDKKWKLGRSFGWWHIPYCPHCKRQLGLMVEEQRAEKCPMCGKPLEWDGADNG